MNNKVEIEFAVNGYISRAGGISRIFYTLDELLKHFKDHLGVYHAEVKELRLKDKD